MNDLEKVRQIIEGLLLAAAKPLTLDKLAELFTKEELPERAVLKEALAEIEKSCEGRGFELKKVASGYRFQVRQELSDWVGRLWEEKPQRYSRALLETLAIIAYRQPITRGDIEKIRGVAVSSSIIRTLLERDWVRVVGHRDVPGRPAMYASTREFLDYFNLENLDELPALTEIRDMEGLNQELTLDEEKPEGNVLEFPTVLEEEDHVVVADEEELAAAAIGTRSIDEILGIKADKDEAEEGEEGEIEADQDEIFEESEQSVSESAESDNVTESDDDEESLA
ncbi:MAG: SMC-Scp complex subunit ScpB [Pseudohongiellaceae bacterium]